MIRSVMKPDFESLFLQTQDQLEVLLVFTRSPTHLWRAVSSDRPDRFRRAETEITEKRIDNL